MLAEKTTIDKSLSNLIKAIEQGIFNETTQTRLLELESQKKALKEAIEIDIQLEKLLILDQEV